MQRIFILACCAITLLFAAAPSVEANPPAQEDLDLKSVIDGSIRWLRTQQNREDGSYPGGIKSTAWVLRALAESPRAYVRRDGPFVEDALEYLASQQRENGAISSQDSGDPIGETLLAIQALERYADPISEKMAARARKSLPVDDASKSPPIGMGNPDLARAKELVGERLTDGSWYGSQGSVVTTAKAIIELTVIHNSIKADDSAPFTAIKLPPFEEADRAEVLASMKRGALFLIAVGDNGKFGAPGRADAGLTAMALSALQVLPKPRPEAVQAQIDAGLAWLVSLQQENGAIHDGKLPNYITSASIMALVRAEDPKYAEPIARAQAFLIALQSDEGEGYDDGDHYYGGIGYGGDERPDLSNLQMALDALSSSKSPEAAEAFRRAVKFLERSQNRSESNDVRVTNKDGDVIRSGDDGGAAYYPGNSVAGYMELKDGTKVPRSYGSMTYALLKGYIFAGLGRDDPRMEAAWKWISANYTLDVNPGFEHQPSAMAAYQGLFYYFSTMARALDLYGQEVITDAEGKQHPWRKQLCGRLIAMQNPENGSWLNENSPRWWEGNPLLSTAYVLLALDSALPPSE